MLHPCLSPILKTSNLDNLAIAAPDMGGTKRANAYARFLGCQMIICYKMRKKPNVVEEMRAIGEIEGKNVFIVDDMIDTAGTITLAAEMMKNDGAKSVSAIATHPILSGPAYERIDQSFLDELLVTDSIPIQALSSKDHCPVHCRSFRRCDKKSIQLSVNKFTFYHLNDYICTPFKNPI